MEAEHHRGGAEERGSRKQEEEGREGGGTTARGILKGGQRAKRPRRRETWSAKLLSWLQRRRVVGVVVVLRVKMSSPCLLRAAPISQPRLREVKLSLKASSRETAAVRSGSGGTKEAAGRPYAPAEREAPARVGVSSSRSRSTPPVHRAHRQDGRRTARGGGKQPEHHPERNGSLLHVPVAAVAPAGLSNFSSSSSSSSSCTPRRQRTSHPHPPPAPLLSTSSSSSSAKSMKRARWLSYSTSNICFNSILDGRFRQLQGTASQWQSRVHLSVHLCAFQRLSPSPSRLSDDGDATFPIMPLPSPTCVCVE